MRYSFVLSYARKDAFVNNDSKRPDERFETFFDKLSARVLNFTGHGGYIDRTDIQPGDTWPDTLATALNNSQALVCLYSASYFQSEHCGREMQIMLQRRREYMKENAGKKPANIVPIIWQPVLLQKIPKTLPQIQYAAPTKDPTKDGVWSVQGAAMETFIEEIAFRIRDAAEETPLEPLPVVPDLDAVRSAFVPPPLPLPEFDSADALAGPGTATFMYASGTAWNKWPWSPPDEAAVLHLCAAVATGKEVELSQLSFEPSREDFAQRIEAARQRNNIVIMLVDPTILANPHVQSCLQEFDRKQYPNMAAVVLWNKNRTPSLEQAVADSLPSFTKQAAPRYHSIEDRNLFTDTIAKTLAAIQIAAINYPYMPQTAVSASEFPVLHSVPAQERQVA
jgi:hypothetical protein